jgi:hypothetical protein
MRCSILCAPLDPVAGLALSGRAMQRSGRRFSTISGMRARMKYQAPMFQGSSCTHTRSVPSA